MIANLEKIDLGDDGFLLVRVGSDSRPATSADIKDVQDALDKVEFLKDRQAVVSHHNIDMQWISNKEPIRFTERPDLAEARRQIELAAKDPNLTVVARTWTTPPNDEDFSYEDEDENGENICYENEDPDCVNPDKCNPHCLVPNF